MAAGAGGGLLASRVNCECEGPASVGAVAAAWGGSAAGRQNEQPVVCVDT